MLQSALSNNTCASTDPSLLADQPLLRRMLETMLLIRCFEDKIMALLADGHLHGTTHLCVGEEATAVGTAFALRREDYLFSTHRGHGHMLAKGADIDAAMAEMLGRETGLCRGRGGSMHLSAPEVGAMSTNGILGAGAPHACGAALAAKTRGEDRVAIVFFGDGASNQGAIHEAMNLAAAWKLPVIFCLINNGYGLSTSIESAVGETDLARRAEAYGMDFAECDGNDVLEVYETARKARRTAREKGPVLLVEHTYRVSGHSKNDENAYRSEEEIAAWEAAGPILRFENFLQSRGLLPQEDIAAIHASAAERIERAAEFALSSPFPPQDSLLEYVLV
ncbi:MAG: thiamine pyrophosphate-dependent dehydrogenase E1 component subunit alpha [Oscillospiraceae bacterium]